jgi:ATP-dependent RNA helicase HelY
LGKIEASAKDQAAGKPKRRQNPAAIPKPLQLDPFQVKAIDFLLEGYSVLVAAPTGTGKTLIAEKLLVKILGLGNSAVYTSPIKALSNQKYRDFGRLFGRDQVGLITGDFSINETAPLLVMTTEIFRNWCFNNPEMLDLTTHVIFDEMHFLDDQDRGTTWEESIIFAPPHIKILGLSATVPNVREIARWMGEIRGCTVKVIEERRRAVPLELGWIPPSCTILSEAEARAQAKEMQQAHRTRPEIPRQSDDKPEVKKTRHKKSRRGRSYHEGIQLPNLQ